MGTTLISGDLVPFNGFSQITLGTATSPFHGVYSTTLYNANGELRINDVTATAPIRSDIASGTVNLGIDHDTTLQVIDGRLSVKPLIRFNEDYDLRYMDPLKVDWDEDGLGGDMFLDTDEDDFQLNEGKLKIKERTYKGFGGVKIGGPTDVDFVDEWLDWGDVVPKMSGIRLQTTDDFTQVTGSLQIRPKGLGQIPY